MKKNMLRLLLAVAVIAISFPFTAAHAGSGDYYVRLNGGYVKTKMTVNTTTSNNKQNISKSGRGVVGSGGVGYYVSDAFRTELEMYYDSGVKAKSSGIGSVKTKSLVGFVNGYFDIMPDSMFVPYVMGGIGYGSTKFTVKYDNASSGYSEYKSKSKRNVAFQLGLGVGFKVTSEIIADLGYRVVSVGSKSADCIGGPQQKDKVTAKTKIANVFMGGVRVNF
jgi:opacity protein-like surface antigen